MEESRCSTRVCLFTLIGGRGHSTFANWGKRPQHIKLCMRLADLRKERREQWRLPDSLACVLLCSQSAWDLSSPWLPPNTVSTQTLGLHLWPTRRGRHTGSKVLLYDKGQWYELRLGLRPLGGAGVSMFQLLGPVFALSIALPHTLSKVPENVTKICELCTNRVTPSCLAARILAAQNVW